MEHETINEYELEQAALIGIEELFNSGHYLNDVGWIRNEAGFLDGDWNGSEIAEALYFKFKGWG